MSDSKFWWELKADECAASLWSTIQSISEEQVDRLEKQALLNLCYGDVDVNISTYPLIANIESLVGINKNQYSFDLIQSVIDTKKSKLLKSLPLPMFVTDGANWSNQILSKKLNKAVTGLFYDLKIEEQFEIVYLHSQIWGTGLLKHYLDIETGKVKTEVVSPTKVLVDLVDGQDGKPRSMYQVEYISKEVLKSKFPEYSKDIEDSKSLNDLSSLRNTDYTTIVEGWHLPCGNTRGKHVISLSDICLVEEDFKKDKFPFTVFRPTKKQSGFWSQGAAERLFNIHVEIKKTLSTIRKCVHLGLVPTLYVNEASKIVSSHFRNEIGNIIKYRGELPIDKAMMTVPQQLFNWVEMNIQRGYEQEGVSQLSAQSKKPSGLDAAVAIREYNDIETERFYTEGKAIERFIIDLAYDLLDDVKTQVEENKDYSVRALNKNIYEEINFKNLDLDNSKYVIKCFPVSSLPQHPAARKEYVSEMIQSGFITQDVGLRLLNIPDIEDEMDKTLSMQFLIDKIIDDIMFSDEGYNPPDLTLDLDYAILRFQKAYNYYRLKNADEVRLNALLDWMQQAQTLIQTTIPEQVKTASASPEAIDAVASEIQAQNGGITNGPTQQQL